MTGLSREQVRLVDRLAEEELGIPGIVLMENAGRSAAEVVLGEIRALAPSRSRVACLCGPGNNGGDGFVLARHLHNGGVEVELFATAGAERQSKDAAVHRNIAAAMGLPIYSLEGAQDLARALERWESCAILVDALLGTGFRGAPKSPMAEVIRSASTARWARVIALDIPSGLDCDSGVPADPCLRADVTVTFVAEKKGFANPLAAPCTGRVVVGSIGTPPELIERARAMAPWAP